MSAVQDCLFCKISAGVIPADVVLESDSAIAFRDIDPKAPTHVLVIPKKHFADVTDLMSNDPDLASELLALATKVAEHEGLATGYRIVTNNGLGGRSLSWPPG
jgi:histidine triad (HIT) family protein